MNNKVLFSFLLLTPFLRGDYESLKNQVIEQTQKYNTIVQDALKQGNITTCKEFWAFDHYAQHLLSMASGTNDPKDKKRYTETALMFLKAQSVCSEEKNKLDEALFANFDNLKINVSLEKQETIPQKGELVESNTPAKPVRSKLDPRGWFGR